MRIPSMLLKQLYTFGSLHNTKKGVVFTLKNRLTDVTLVALHSVQIDGEEIPPSKITMALDDENETVLTPEKLNQAPLAFPLRQSITFRLKIDPLSSGKHKIVIEFETEEYGKLKVTVEDAISDIDKDEVRIPRDVNDDYSRKIIRARQKFLTDYTDTKPKHIFKYSFDPHVTQGNIENFTGVAQIPLGIAGPIKVNGEYAQGEFIVPMATTEGTLVASYNRGMKVLNLSGGATVTVVGDAMQRAPVFIFDNAREARDFTTWVQEHFDQVKEEAEGTSSVAKLTYIDYYLSNKFAYLRFNYTTGDAAGQNMVGRATFVASSWIIDNYPGNITRFYLESNLATDKKASQVNIMRTRGKRVIAEATIPRDVLIQRMRVEPESLAYHYGVANVGAILSGANNNGLHSANGITAIFIATGQDVANVSESSAGILYAELTPEKDLYISITIPSLIVATYGGGTGLPTQRENLELLGCFGKDKVKKFAEIVAATVLAGEISLAAAISTTDWVSSHERYGRNR